METEDRKDSTTQTCKMKTRELSVEEMLTVVGGFGKFQKTINLIFCVMTIPSCVHIMITYFAADTPSWTCAPNSTHCRSNETFTGEDQSRCLMSRHDWSYVAGKHYSIVTEWDIDCDKAWLKELVMSIFFLGWLIGAPLLGWVADNYGRRRVLIHSLNIVLLLGFLTSLAPNIYLFIFCRFLVAFFITGTFPQMFVIITEVVGGRYRTFSGIIIYTFCAVSLAIVGVVAYFIREWKLLYMVTSAPYIVVVVLYRFIPESVQYLYVKRETQDLLTTFRRISAWNKRPIPNNISVAVYASDQKGRSYPFELFKVKSLAWITLVQSVILFLNVVTYYGLYIAAGDIGGSLYIDYVVVTVAEIPISLIAICSSNRYGRKPTTLVLVLLSLIACVGLIFTPNRGLLQNLRIIQGMIGKSCNGAAYLVLTSWGADLYPTKYRSEALGMLQVFTRVGGMCAPWMGTELNKIRKGLSFIFMSIASLVSCMLVCALPRAAKDSASTNPEEEGNGAENTLEVPTQTNGGFDGLQYEMHEVA